MAKRKVTIEQKPPKSTRRKGFLWLIGICGALTLFSVVGQELGFIPTTEERNATRTAEANAIVAQVTVETPEAQLVVEAETSVTATETITTTTTNSEIVTSIPDSTPPLHVEQVSIETPTATEIPTNTTTPTATDTNTATFTINPTNTATFTRTPSATFTDTPTQHPTATQQAGTYYALNSVSLQGCPQYSNICNMNRRVEAGTPLEVIGTAEGQIITGTNLWFIVNYSGREFYAHSSLVTTTRPSPTSSAPVVNPPVPPSEGVSCPSLSATCSQLTCEQAYACLAAGNQSLDRDRDGIPCESVCR